MIIALLVAAVLALTGIVALGWRRLRLIEQDLTAYERDMGELEGRLMEALDVLDAEIGAATEAERIIERAHGGKVFVVPATRWMRRHGSDKRITGVLIVLALVGSAGIAVQQLTDAPERPQHRPESAVVVSTTAPAPTTALPAEVPEPPATTEPATTAPSPPTSTTTATQTTTTTAPLASDGFAEALISLQLSDELPAGILGEGGVPDLADVVAAEVGNDLPGVEDTLDMVESCLSGDEPSSAEDCSRLDATDPLD